MAFASIKAHKLRSTLTILGVTVGVFSIISVMTAMSVLVNSIEKGMSQLGVNTFQVQKFPNFNSGGPRERQKYRNRKNIIYLDGIVVQQKTKRAKYVGIESWSGGQILENKLLNIKTNPNVEIVGENTDGLKTNNWPIEEGREFTQDEFNTAKNVCIIGGNTKEKLFQKQNAIGNTIDINGYPFTVIGIVKTQGGMLGGSNDNFAVIPLTKFFQLYGKDRNIHIMVQSFNRESFDDCIDEVRGIMRERHKLSPSDEDDFYIFSNESMIKQFNEFTFETRIGIMVISLIALLASGIGIMNIMLVSVTERTKEIGIRKSIGATKKNILTQFLMEAIILSQIGGIIGIIFGITLGNILAMYLEVPAVIPYNWVAIGFVSCLLVGVGFGVYPSWKASKLNPIDALRYEN